MRDFILLRHGQTDWNADGLFQGRTDQPLNAEGRAQAVRAASTLVDVNGLSAVVTSPLQRAKHTAFPIASACGLTMHTDPGLIECDFGSLEGTSIADFMTANGVQCKAGLAKALPSDAERWADLGTRASTAVGQWQRRVRQGLLVFVSHDATIQALAEQLCGRGFECQHGTPYLVRHSRGSWAISDV